MNIQPIQLLLLLLAVFISACGEKPLDETIANDNNTDAVLLEGDAGALAINVITNLDLNDGIPDSDTGTDSAGRKIALTEIEIWLTGQSTVGEVNDLLRSINASIVNSLANMPYLLVRIPNPGSAGDLETLIAQIEADLIVAKVYTAGFFSTNQLPDNISSNPETIALPEFYASEIDLIGNQLAIKAHAAWNASQALDNFTLSTPPMMLVTDMFGGGAPNGDYDVSVQEDSDFYTNYPNKHGYHVLGIIAARQGGSDTQRGWVTGIYPGTLPIRAVDIRTNSGSTLSFLAIENRILKRIRDYPGTNLVLNTSLGVSCGPINNPVTCSSSIIENDAIRWITKVRDAGLENKFIHITAAGNRLTDENMDAKYDSGFTAAKLVNNLVSSTGSPVTNLANILVVENIMISSHPFKPVCISRTSKYGGDISAIGSGVWSLTGASSGADWLNGTSMAAPQVAGLAAYIWALAPGLSAGEVINLIDYNSHQFQINPSTYLGCGPSQPANALDAYASVLAVDHDSAINGNGQPVDARIRGTILDIADNTGAPGSNGQFDEKDLEIWLYMFQTAIPELDYSRYDLNGDGRTGGDTTERFDLDIDHRFSSQVSHDIEGESVIFNENHLTDMKVLCYYAYSALYTGDTDERSRQMVPYLNQCGSLPKLAFSRDFRYQPGALYRLDSAGAQLVWEAPSYGPPVPVSWSPDGTKILFIHEGKYYVANADGSGAIWNSGSNGRNEYDLYAGGRWTADSSGIILLTPNQLASDGTSRYFSTYHIDLAMGERTLLTSEGHEGWELAFSNDGSKLAFSMYVPDISSSNLDIYLADVDGSGLTRLTSDLGEDWFPSFSPDGGKILFRSARAGNGEDWWVISPGESARMVIPNAPNVSFSWSPDGSRLVYSRSSSEAGDEAGDIYVVELTSGIRTRLTSGPEDDHEPVWSPHGDRIVFIRGSLENHIPGFGLLYVMDADGSNLQQITAGAAADAHPLWE